jgi:hypothetical protein
VVGESIPQIRDRVRSMIRGADACTREPMPCREPLVVKNSGFEEVHNVLMLPIFGAVARDVKCRVTRGVLGKLVTLKIIVWAALRDPMPAMLLSSPGCVLIIFTYLFMYSKRSYLPNGSRKVPIFGPL